MKTITLTGMMGCGKTSVAEALADKLGLNLVEIDRLIEQSEEGSISRIFEQKGEWYFRKLEKTIILNTVKSENQIVALGGGAFEDEETRDFLRKTTAVVYLQATPEVIFERVKNDNTRPLLENNMTLEKIDEIIKKREHNYQKAEFAVDTDDKTIIEVVQEIIGVLS